jgi:hypothetical protein
VRVLNRVEPHRVQLRVAGDDVRFDVLGHRLVHVPLAQLRVPEAGPVADELVREAPRHAGDEKVPDGVFEHAAVADFLDVVEVGRVPARARLREAHVTDAAGRLGQHLGGDLAVALPAHAVVGEEAVQLLLVHGLAAEDVHRRFRHDANAVHLRGRVRGWHDHVRNPSVGYEVIVFIGRNGWVN